MKKNMKFRKSTLALGVMAALAGGQAMAGTTVDGTLGVTGAISLSTLNTSGLATLDSATVTNNATVGGTLGVTGKTTTNGLRNTDAFTQTGGVVSINDSSNFATSINTGTSSGNVEVGNASKTVSILGNNNNIGNAGASTNTLTGSTNTVTATGANTVSGATNSITATAGANNITAGTTNTVTATTGNNEVTATGCKGANNLTANATTGTNNIEAKFNNIGVSTAASINAIGNTNASTTVNASAGAGYQALKDTSSSMGTGAGGMVQTNATTATIRASSSGTLASNGSTGAMVAGAGGGYTAYNSQQNTGSSTIGGVVDNKLFTNKINGNTFIDGNVYINGTLDYVSRNSANTTVIGAGAPATTSNIQGATQATSAGIAILMKGSTGTQTVVDANGKLSNVTTGTGAVAAQSTASMTLTDGIGNTHGLVVTESQASLSGGVNSSTLTMDDRGATFSNAANGAPVTVTGVANGRADFDAVNVRQFAGAIAAVTAQTNVPALAAGQDRSIGIGVGNFMGKNGFGLGHEFPQCQRHLQNHRRFGTERWRQARHGGRRRRLGFLTFANTNPGGEGGVQNFV